MNPNERQLDISLEEAELLATYPSAWCKVMLGWDMYDWQAQVIDSLADPDRDWETSV